MTPIQAAVDAHVAFYSRQPRDPGSEGKAHAIAVQGMTRAIAAYLQAGAKDEGTVEAVVKAACENADGGECEYARPGGCDCTLPSDIRAALTSLASRVKA